MAEIEAELVARPAWWVMPFIKTAALFARFGLPVDPEWIVAVTSRGFRFITRTPDGRVLSNQPLCPRSNHD